jgi:hypothetical protein
MGVLKRWDRTGKGRTGARLVLTSRAGFAALLFQVGDSELSGRMPNVFLLNFSS